MAGADGSPPEHAGHDVGAGGGDGEGGVSEVFDPSDGMGRNVLKQ
jgi:hypothetical protein